MKKFLFPLLFFLFCPALWGQGIERNASPVLSGNARPIAGAHVWVCTGVVGTNLPNEPPCTPQATIYTDYYMMHPITQPLVTDGFGNYDYFGTSGPYTECITGTMISPGYCKVITLGGGSGSGTLTSFSAGNLPPIFTTSVNNPTTTPNLQFSLTNAPPLTVFGNSASSTGVPTYYQLPQTFTTSVSETASLPNSRVWVNGMNTTVNTSTPGQIAIDATGGGGGSGCTLPGIDTGVLSEHPVGTCYNSLDFTWDDSNINLQIGDGSNTIGTTGLFETFTKGRSNGISSDGISSTEDIFTEGRANTQSSALGSSSLDNWIRGENNLATSTSADSTAQFNFLDGQVEQATADSGGGVGAVFMSGQNNTAHSSGTDGNTSSIYSQSENSTFSSNASNVSDIFSVGEHDSATSSGASSDVDTAVMQGFHLGLTSTSGHTLTQAFQFGDTDTVTSTGSNVTSAYELGSNLSLTDCSNCFAIGNDITSTTSNWLGIGLSATSEIVVTPGHIKFNAPLVMDPSYIQNVPQAFASLPTCNSGQTGTFATVNNSTVNTYGTTITGGGSNNVQAFCNGTNWVVSAGGTATALALQTNGTPNGSQSLLNLAAGSNITLTDGGTGTITIAASGSGGATTPAGSINSVQTNADGSNFGAVTLNATATKKYLQQVSSGAPTFEQIAAGEISGLAASATTDTTNAANISSGTLPHARLPTLLSGDIPNNAANTSGNANTATALASAPSLCPGGQAPTGILASGNATGCAAIGGSGTVSSIATTAPLTGGPITTTGTIACATCVVASSPGAGIPHFAGSTQTVTSSPVSLTSDISGILPAANGGTGQNSASSTGVAQVSGGAWSVSTSLANGTKATTQAANDNSTNVATTNYADRAISNFNPLTTIGDVWGGGASGAPARIAGGLTGQSLTSNNGASSAFASPGVGGRTVSGTTDTILCDSGTTLRDRGTTIVYTSSSAVAVTLPQAGSTGCSSNFIFSIFVTGSGAVTITPTTSTLNGQSTMVLGQNSWVSISSPDNTNYIARPANYIKAGAGLTPTYNADSSTTLSTIPATTDYATASGSVNAMTASTTACPASLTAGLSIKVLANFANTSTTPTLNYCSIGAKNILKSGTVALRPGDYNTTLPMQLTYDGTQWQLMNPIIPAHGIVWICSVYTTSTFSAPTVGTVILTCPNAIPANFLLVGDVIKGHFNAEVKTDASHAGQFVMSPYLGSINIGEASCDAFNVSINQSSADEMREWTMNVQTSIGSGNPGWESCSGFNSVVGTSGNYGSGDIGEAVPLTSAYTPTVKIGNVLLSVNTPTGSTVEPYSMDVQVITP